MAEIVVDASALAALIFREPEGEAVLHRCQGESLFAPQLLDYEMANICVTKQRRDRTHAALLASQARHPWFLRPCPKVRYGPGNLRRRSQAS